MRSIKNINVKNKRVLVRVDFNVARDKNNRITDSFRIKESLPTIHYLMANGARVVLISHLGRPEANSAEDRKKLSLEPVAKYIRNNYSLKIDFVKDCVGGEVRQKVGALGNGEVVLLENLRFYSEEEKNDPKFSKQLADLADIYVNDAFGASHRKHASVVGITKFLPSCAGLLLEKEIVVLSKILKNPGKPAIAVIGGVKLETKLPLIQSLLKTKNYDYILIGGRLGLELFTKDKRLVVPTDYHGAEKFDIGDNTVEEFKKNISRASTIIWNGPMGMFENKKFEKGTRAVANAIANSSAFKVIGGGDTVAAVDKYKLFDKMDFVSTGGGAMLELLSGKKLVGIESLNICKVNA